MALDIKCPFCFETLPETVAHDDLLDQICDGCFTLGVEHLSAANPLRWHRLSEMEPGLVERIESGSRAPLPV